MPFLIPAAAVAISTFVITGGAFVAAGIVFAVTAALGFIASKLAPKPKLPNFADFTTTARARTLTVRQPAAPWQIIYGETRVGGPMALLQTTDDNRMLHIVAVMAAHECEDIPEVLLNDFPIHMIEDLDDDGFVKHGHYMKDGRPKVRIKAHLGSASQEADADLVSAVTEWTTEHRGRGHAYVYVRMEQDTDIFPTGIPNISAWVRGKKVLSSRTSTEAWSFNPPECIRDYFQTSREFGGLGATTLEFDDDFTVAAANTSEEIFSVSAITVSVEDVSTNINGLIMAGETLRLQTGDRVKFQVESGSAPAGLADDGVYYAVPYRRFRSSTTVTGSDQSRVFVTGPVVKLATSFANALTDTAVAITTDPGGTYTLLRTGEPRYTMNGVFELDRQPADVADDMLTACGGSMVYGNGKWRILAGDFQVASVEFTEADIIGAIRAQTRHGRRQRFNAVKGTFLSPINFGQPSDYPPVESATYLSEDQDEHIYHEMDLPWTSRASEAQRLAKIVLERHRQEVGMELTTNLKGLQVQAGDTIKVSVDRLGLPTLYIVEEWALQSLDGGEDDEATALGCRMVLRQHASGLFDYQPDEEVIEDPVPPVGGGGNPFDPALPRNLTLESGGAVLFVKGDGTVISRIKASWDRSLDGLARQYEAQAKLTSGQQSFINGAHFSEGDYVSAELSDLTGGLSGSPQLLISEWVRRSDAPDSTSSTEHELVAWGSSYVQIASDNTLEALVVGQTGSTLAHVKTSTAINHNNWFHYAFAVNLLASVPLVQLYLNGKSNAEFVVSAEVGSVAFGSALFRMAGGTASVNQFVGDRAQLYFNASETLNLATGGNMLALYDQGRATDPGDDGTEYTSNQPEILLNKNKDHDNTPTEWLENQGSGDDVSMGSGTLSALAIEPPGHLQGGDWAPIGSPVPADGPLVAYVFDVQDGVQYDVRVRTVTVTQARSAWLYERAHTVVGKTGLPEDVTGFTATKRERDIEFMWNAVDDLDISHYELRWASTSTVFADANVITQQAHGTGYIWNTLAPGDIETYIKAVDTSGNKSDEPDVAAIEVNAPPAPAVTASISGPDLVLEWNEVTADFGVKNYRVSYGSTAGDVITDNIDGTRFQTNFTWASTRTWYVEARDNAGTIGDAGNVAVTNTPPTAQNLTATVIDNNVLLRWGVSLGTLPIDYYEIRRGATFATATVIGIAYATFTVIFETEEGLNTYWISPVDTSGNAGTETSITTQVDAPKDFVFRSRFDSDLIGNNPIAVARETSERTAVDFDGSDDTASTGLQLSSVVAKGHKTLEAWVWQRSSQTLLGSVTEPWKLPGIIGNQGGHFGIAAGAADGTKLRFWSRVSSGEVGAIEASGLQTSTWMHVALTHDAPHLRGYVNGALIDSVTIASVDDAVGGDAGAGIRFGHLWENASSPFFAGYVDDMRVWSGARSSAEIASNYAQELLGEEGDLLGYWRCQEGENDVARDLSENQNHAVLFSADWVVVDPTAVMPFEIGETFQDHFSTQGWSSPADQISAGFDQFLEEVPASASFVETYNVGALVDTSQIVVTPTYAVTGGSPSVHITLLTRASHGEAWTEHGSGETDIVANSFQFIQVRFRVNGSGGDDHIRLSKLTTAVKTKLVSDQGNITVTGNPTVVSVTESFNEIKAVTVTPQSASSLYAVADWAPASTGSFGVYLFDQDGSARTGTVGWLVRGV